MPVTLDDVKASLKRTSTAQTTPESGGGLGGIVPVPPNQPVLGDNAPAFLPSMLGAEQPMGTPRGKPLQGKVAETVNPLQLLAESALLGFASTPESIGNLGLGLGAELSQIPQEKRMNVSDMLRMIPGLDQLQTPADVLNSPEFQAKAASSPQASLAAGAGGFGGGLAFPIGGLIGTGSKIAGGAINLASKFAPGVMQGLSNMKNLAALQKLGQMAQTPVGKAAQMAGTGAGYATAFGAGNEYGQSKKLPTAGETAGSAAVGAGTALGIAGLGKVAKNFMGGGKPGQMTQTGTASKSNDFFGMGQVDKTPDEVGADLQRALIAINESGIDDPKLAERLFTGFRKKYGGSGDDYKNAIAKVRQAQYGNVKKGAETEQKQEFQVGLIDRRQQNSEKMQQRRRADKKEDTAEARQYREGQKKADRQARSVEEERKYNRKQRDKRAETEQKQGEKRQEREYKEGREQNKTTQKTGDTAKSGGSYEKLYDRIGNAGADEVDDLEKQIYNPGERKDGSRLLDSAQQRNLAARLRKRKKELSDENPPGKAKGGDSTAKSESPPQSKPTQQPQAKPPEPAKADEAASGSFSLGVFRKVLNKAQLKAEDRHKNAVDSKTVAKMAGLNAEEAAALKEWSKELAELSVEKKQTQQQLDQLADWALKHPNSWEPSITEFTTQSTANSLAIQKAGTVKRVLIQSKVEKELSGAQERELAAQRNELWQQGVRQGKIDPKRDQKINRAHVSSTVGGKVERVQVDGNGMLDAGKVKPVQSGKFTPPKNLEELWQRAQFLTEKMKTTESAIKDLKEGNGEYDLLDDGRSMGDLLGQVFKRQKKAWAEVAGDPDATPNINMWDVHDGHVVTHRWEQAAVRKTFGEHAKDLEAAYKKLYAQAKAESDRTKTSFSISINNARAITGLEPLAIAMVAGRKIGELARKTPLARPFYVGTIRDILRNAPDLNLDPRKFATGRQVANALDDLGGTILDAFSRYRDNLAPISGAEDLTMVLNKFKGIDTNKIMRAKVNATEEERRTAFMLRSHYDKLSNKIVKPLLDELDARANDIKLQQIPRERLKNYTPDDFDKNGKLRTSVYDPLFHDAVRELYGSLKLKGKEYHAFTNFIGGIVSRKQTSIFAGSIKHGIANFVDNAPTTIAYFGQDWAKAWSKMNLLFGSKKARSFVDTLPIVPQGDMAFIEREAARANRPEASNNVERLFNTFDDINHTLSVKWDFLFKGRERIVNAADRWYTRTAAVASVYSQARKLGIPGDQLLNGLIDNTLDPKLRSSVFRNMTADLTQLYNTIQPHLAKDLLVHDPMGQVLTPYSGGARRGGRLMHDWAASSDPVDKRRFIYASAMYLGMGGRAIVPPIVRNAMIYGAAAVGASTPVVQAFQNLDKANVLRNTTGWDVSDRISYDAFNAGSPMTEGISQVAKKGLAVGDKEKTAGAATVELSWQLFGVGLSAFPKVSFLGTGTINSINRASEYAKQGWRPITIKTALGDKSYRVPYNANDAYRDIFFAGPSPTAQKLQQQDELRFAQKRDLQVKAAGKRQSEGSVNLLNPVRNQ